LNWTPPFLDPFPSMQPSIWLLAGPLLPLAVICVLARVQPVLAAVLLIAFGIPGALVIAGALVSLLTDLWPENFPRRHVGWMVGLGASDLTLLAVAGTVLWRTL
jgi:hypothetical protein